MKAEFIASIIGVVIIFVTTVSCVTYYNLQRDLLMKSNVESAIVKGIDPMSVRCAYGSSDSVCIVYTANLKK
jgi:hypothetical protein